MIHYRSMLAQLVPKRELGKVYGLLAILDAALPFLGKPVSCMSPSHNCFSTSPGKPPVGCNHRYHARSFLPRQCWGEGRKEFHGSWKLHIRLWASLAFSILLCGPSSVSTICTQPPPPPSLIIGMFCLLCAARRKKLLLSCGEPLFYESPFSSGEKNHIFHWKFGVQFLWL